MQRHARRVRQTTANSRFSEDKRILALHCRGDYSTRSGLPDRHLSRQADDFQQARSSLLVKEQTDRGSAERDLTRNSVKACPRRTCLLGVQYANPQPLIPRLDRLQTD